MLKKVLATLAALTLTLGVPAAALANTGDAAEAQGHPKFPMAAAEFRQKVDHRMTKAREKMERRASKLGAEQAKELRARFNAGAAQVQQEVTKVTADGTVTKDEARQVRAAVRAAIPRRHHGNHGKHEGK